METKGVTIGSIVRLNVGENTSRIIGTVLAYDPKVKSHPWVVEWGTKPQKHQSHEREANLILVDQ